MSHLAAAPAPELSAYHDRSIALLRRYFRMSLEIGRMPSVLGREVFRARVTSYRVHTFEDAVIFVHDVEKCLEQLEPFSRQLIARVILQDYSYEEAARLVGCGERTVYRLLPLALDRSFFMSRTAEPNPETALMSPKLEAHLGNKIRQRAAQI